MTVRNNAIDAVSEKSSEELFREKREPLWPNTKFFGARLMKQHKFPFSVFDWRTSRTVQRMSMSERGVYWEMLCAQWDQGPLPDDAQAVADLIASSESQVQEVLAAFPVVRRKFLEYPGGRLENQRLERERTSRASKPILADTSSVVLTFPTIGKTASWELRQAQIEAWQELFPSISVRQECQKALAWVMANERKTATGMARFLVSWLNRATNDRRHDERGSTDRRIGGRLFDCPHDVACRTMGECAVKQRQAS